MRKLIVSVLEAFGVKDIYSAENGQQGFDKFKQFNPDIVITDWQMHPGNGIELIEKIRTNAASPNRMVPIILVTGYSAVTRVLEARDRGVTELLIKPFTANDLAKRLAHIINKPRDFIEAAPVYVGPDRRRRAGDDYAGPKRRRSESSASGSGNTKPAGSSWEID